MARASTRRTRARARGSPACSGAPRGSRNARHHIGDRSGTTVRSHPDLIRQSQAGLPEYVGDSASVQTNVHVDLTRLLHEQHGDTDALTAARPLCGSSSSRTCAKCAKVSTMLINGTSGFQCAGSYRTMEDALNGISGTQTRCDPDGYRTARDERRRRDAHPARTFSRGAHPGADGLRRRRQCVQRDLRRRVRLSAEEHRAGAAAGIAQGSRRRRRADVTRRRAPGGDALPPVPSAGACPTI